MISFFVAMVSSILILFASKISYRNYVNRESEKFSKNVERDILDKISDPYDLYSEDEILEETHKKPSILENKKDILKAVPVYFSVFRIFSYIFLVIGFIYLQDNQLMEIGYYLLGITAGIISMLLINNLKKT
jgi:hypothetical protein